MKVIKRVRRQSPGQKLSHFFSEMGIITKIILVLYTAVASILKFTSHQSTYSFAGLFSMRITEIILFVIIGISDIKREQEKGSFFLLLTFLFKNIVILLIHQVISSLAVDWPQFEVLSHTAIPIQYLFVLMVQGAFEDPENLKYLFIEPFQLKSKFYPLFFFTLLMITSIRVDLLIPFVLALLYHFAKVNVVVLWVSKALNRSFLTERMLGFGFIKEESKERRSKQMDEMVTNDSIFYEQK